MQSSLHMSHCCTSPRSQAHFRFNGKAIHCRNRRPHCRAAESASRAVLSPQERMKLDTSEDRQFYGAPRFVKHVDDGFLSQLTELYRQRIPAGGVVLDLMSSWVSHLPPEVQYSRVIGHGMNATELARNPQLSEFFVRDLNKDPDGWALPDKSVDAVICCVSVQYLQQPERVFAEIYRVLKPGGVCIMAFSNRMFYGKAIQAWRETTMYGRVQLVRQYFQCIPGFTEPENVSKVAMPASSAAPQGLLGMIAGLFKPPSNDPFCAVISYRNIKPLK